VTRSASELAVNIYDIEIATASRNGGTLLLAVDAQQSRCSLKRSRRSAFK